MGSQKTTAAKKIAAQVDAQEELGLRILRALDLQAQINEAKEELDSIKAFFEEFLSDEKSEQRLATKYGVAILKTANSFSVDVDKIPELKKKLGENYKDFVSEKVSYGCSAHMKAKINDGDYKHVKLIREATLIKTTKSVVFEAVKEIKPKLYK